MAKQKLKEIGINPEQRAKIVPRKNQIGDKVTEDCIARVNELLNIAQQS